MENLEKPKKRLLWIWITITIIIAALIILVAVKTASEVIRREGKPDDRPENLVKSPGNAVDLNNLPKFIQADFIDLTNITAISKFRSGSGHDFSQGTGETCRSMKHYYNSQQTKESQEYRNANKGMPPKFTLMDAIKVFAPVNGKVTKIESEQVPIGKQVYIRPTDYPEFTIRLFHIENIGPEVGDEILAGERIGYIGRYSNTDIAVELNQGGSMSLVSYFEVMPDDIFAEYQKRGVKNRNDFIITKDYRDANPLACNGEQFAKNYDSDQSSDNFVFLSGYLNVDKNLTGPDTSAGTRSGPGGGAGDGSGNGVL